MAIRIDELDRALAERSFSDFVRQAWPILEPTTRFEGNWHIDLLSEYMESVASGEINRLVINLPPRFGKSLQTTIFFPCWVWIHDPSERFMFASYSSTLSTKHSIDRRTLIRSRWYQRRWGATVKLADDLNLKTEFANTQRGHMIATSVGASATGRGGNFLMVDDLINPDQANSDLERQAAIRWFDETFSTRLDNKRTGRMLVIEQRTHQADLTGHLLAQGGWEQVSLPAIAERKSIVVFPRSRTEVVREQDDLLWPAREGRAELEAAKVRLGSFAFAAQYQQAPVSREGNLIKVDWLTEFYRPGGLPPNFDSILISLDTAFKTDRSNDYSAMVVIGTLSGPRDGFLPGHYLLDAWRARVEFPDLKRKVVEMQAIWHANNVLVEDAASGQSLIQELGVQTRLPLKPIKPDRDKFSRVSAVSPILEAHRLILPEFSSWRGAFIAELTSFPNGAFDDWVDALAQALNELRGNPLYQDAFTAVKRLAAYDRLRQGLSLEDTAARVGLSTAEVRSVADRTNHIREDLRRRISRNGRKDDPRYNALAEKMIAAHLAKSSVHIDFEQYRDYVRPILGARNDPGAVSLMTELDRFHGLA